MLSGLDTAGLAQRLAQLAERQGDLADAFFERVEEVEVASEDGPPAVRVRREEGFAVRLLRGRSSWLAARDEITAGALAGALRQVARVEPRGLGAPPPIELPEAGEVAAEELVDFPAALEGRLRDRHVAFPLRLRVRRHRRWIRVVGTRLAADPETESYYSCSAETPWGRFGALLSELGPESSERLAGRLASRFRARAAPPPQAGVVVAVLGPDAAAVLLHEAVAHALETDTLALAGSPEAAVGLTIGGEELSVLDDPASAPAGVRRVTDDEGSSVLRRWLLRSGVVEQPLADLAAARGSTVLAPGAARRAGRHLPPAPRSTHLEVLPGGLSEAELLDASEGGLFLPEASRGRLDPLTGWFALHSPYGRRIHRGEPADRVGGCEIRGRVADLLTSIRGIGSEQVAAGAGWCAKAGQRLPVWATTPALRLEGVRLA